MEQLITEQIAFKRNVVGVGINVCIRVEDWFFAGSVCAEEFFQRIRVFRQKIFAFPDPRKFGGGDQAAPG